ncbi:MAG: hypothetical protein ACTHMJ_11870 [Thermomicrobiales bacterium]|jgi:hypothetical protein|nr:hypothetical protein [Thermomicrobiales bacterium]
MANESFGQVPPETPPYLRHTVAAVARIVGALPGLAPSEWNRVAYRLVLAGVLRDWVENGTDALVEQDERDLADLLRVAATVALDADYNRRDDTFAVVAAAMVDDWVQNWNTDGN